MDAQVQIAIDRRVKTFVQSVPKRVAAARKQPLKEDLIRMEKLRVIENIEKPTERYAPCIAVLKEKCICMCIDFTNLKSVKKNIIHCQHIRKL